MISLAAILRRVCPSCRRGPIFRGWIAVHEQCPHCGLKFEREPGYFLASMYISYALSVPLFLLLLVALWTLTHWPLRKLLIGTQLVFLLFVPWIVRYSRSAWIHLDRHFDPES